MELTTIIDILAIFGSALLMWKLGHMQARDEKDIELMITRQELSESRHETWLMENLFKRAMSSISSRLSSSATSREDLRRHVQKIEDAIDGHRAVGEVRKMLTKAPGHEM